MPLGLYLCFRTPAGPRGLWWGLVAGLAAVAIFLVARVRIRMRRDLVRIIIEDDLAAAPPVSTLA
jgi:Na+-driven multidrug efflux pump